MIISMNFGLIVAIPAKIGRWQLKFYTVRYPTAELNVVKKFQRNGPRNKLSGPHSYFKVSPECYSLLYNLELKMSK